MIKVLILLFAISFLFIACENGIEHTGEFPEITRTDYQTVYTEIFQNNCVGCHGNANAFGDLNLEANGYDAIVNVSSTQVPSLLRVKPNDSENSYLYQKMIGAEGLSVMPPSGALSQAKIDLLKTWIDSGVERR